jgi:hypothetical protein
MYRNKKLKDSARFENCVSCGAPDTCWCHSNESKHGKSAGMKSSDMFGFFGCLRCHDWYDSRSKIAPPSAASYRFDKERWFREMWERSMIIACEKGYI